MLAATAEAISRFHDPGPGAMVRVAVAPCSPFSVSQQLMRESAELARRLGVRMHTHLAETREEDAYCRQTLGRTPAEFADDLGWLGEDVWLAHGVHLDEPAVKRLAVTGTSVAHCPTSNARLGAGIAPVRQLLRAGAAVGLGVDGPASSEGTTVVAELHQALLAARLRDEQGPAALTARQALWLGTRGGASCLGRATRSARCGRACWPTSRCGGSTPSPTRPSPTRPAGTRWPRSSSGRPPRWRCSWSAGPRGRAGRAAHRRHDARPPAMCRAAQRELGMAR